MERVVETGGEVAEKRPDVPPGLMGCDDACRGSERKGSDVIG